MVQHSEYMILRCSQVCDKCWLAVNPEKLHWRCYRSVLRVNLIIAGKASKFLQVGELYLVYLISSSQCNVAAYVCFFLSLLAQKSANVNFFFSEG